MADEVRAGAEPHFAEDGGEPFADPAVRPGVGMVLAGAIALAASGGLAWWFAGAGRPDDVSAASAPAAPPPAAAPAQPIRYAAPDPSPDAVRRAWRDVQTAYVDGGADALVSASQACARGVPVEPQRLDYCLAYDIYASAVAPERQADWFAGSGDRGLALARTALPEGVDAHNRLAQVAALSRAVLPKAVPPRPRPQLAHAVRHVPARAHAVKAHARKVHALKAKPPHRAPAARPKLVRARGLRPFLGRPAPYARAQDARSQGRDAREQFSDDPFANRAPPPPDTFDPPH